MSKTKDLYGVEPEHFKDMSWIEALEERIKLAKKRKFHLVRELGDIHNPLILKIDKAILWCQQGLDEFKH